MINIEDLLACCDPQVHKGSEEIEKEEEMCFINLPDREQSSLDLEDRDGSDEACASNSNIEQDHLSSDKDREEDRKKKLIAHFNLKIEDRDLFMKEAIDSDFFVQRDWRGNKR